MVLRVSGQRMVPKEAATALFKHAGTLLGAGLMQWSSGALAFPLAPFLITCCMCGNNLGLEQRADKPQQW